MDLSLISASLIGIVLLLVLILYFRIHAFISLLIASIAVGLIVGMPIGELFNSIQQGMGSTLGFVALVVGLGAIFGAILEHSGGALAMANYMIKKLGVSKAPWAMSITGFIIAIPVFFDVAFIILVPVIYALQKATKKSLLLFAIPLLSGLVITHAFIPPTPGPVAVADIIGVELGWVILMGIIVGLPVAILTGPIFGKWISKRIHLTSPNLDEAASEEFKLPIGILFGIIAIPIVLIILGTLLKSEIGFLVSLPEFVQQMIELCGHPVSALIISNLVAWYVLGIRNNFSKEQLLDISNKSIAPAGLIILLTGAGGVFKQILIDTGTGEMLANYFAHAGLSTLVFAYIAAVLIRILQGSATVAMITAAGLTAPLIQLVDSDLNKALLVIAIASGASIMSHVNDSGFWLVSKYLGMDEKQTFKSWTLMTTIISISGFSLVMLLSIFV